MRIKIAELRDDLDGGRAQETVPFAIDGNRYQLDLSAKNATKLRALLKPYIDAAVISQYRQAIDRHLDIEVPRTEAATVRKWANRMNPGSVAARGRIPHAIYLAYSAAHATASVPTPEEVS